MKRPGQQLRALERFHDALRASAIAEEIERVDVEEKATEALDIMNRNHFDVLGLSENERIVGYLAKGELEKKDDLTISLCGSFKKNIEETDQVPESCPLEDCLSLLQEKEHLFIHTSETVHGIITRADLHKQPVRMLLFSVISLLEMAFLSLIHQEYENDEDRWISFLRRKPSRRALNLHKRMHRENVDIDLASCLQLCDKAQIIRQTETLRKSLGVTSEDSWEGLFDDLVDIRHALAHGLAFKWLRKETRGRLFQRFQEAQNILHLSINLLDGGEDQSRRAMGRIDASEGELKETDHALQS